MEDLPGSLTAITAHFTYQVLGDAETTDRLKQGKPSQREGISAEQLGAPTREIMMNKMPPERSDNAASPTHSRAAAMEPNATSSTTAADRCLDLIQLFFDGVEPPVLQALLEFLDLRLNQARIAAGFDIAVDQAGERPDAVLQR